ncbi:hypothetical protein EYZ11_002571 [Aspergillus tanneri]|uniref:Pre-uroporphyrinogen synthase n=1 Tax=Aspergillus tanneri TaxID=1220188 RepID=A0A4V3UQ76_9EURO|nr:porphobilinogen deaminase [Aspergillus tanneri]KAA8652548.1 porphobilinogen deaminase [Aspergillus tanneri]THC97934.1 hypothetical protein EYZ11_002571 [Aspergillus tanneri]
MSAAGLERVGLKHRINQYLGSKDGGILHANATIAQPTGRSKSTLACLAERSLMRTLERDWSVRISVEMEWIGQSKALRMSAIVVSLDGSQSAQDTTDTTVHSVDEATVLG